MEQLKTYGPQAAKVVGSLVSAKGDMDTGASAEAVAKYLARQLEQNAGQQMAVASVAAQEEARQSDLIASRAMAVAAASGAGTLDPSVVKILQGIRAEGALATATQVYNGMETARGMEEEAKATRFEGRSYKSAYKRRALSTLLTGLNDVSNTWGSDPPPNKKAKSKEIPTSDAFDNGKYDRAYA